MCRPAERWRKCWYQHGFRSLPIRVGASMTLPTPQAALETAARELEKSA
jgi:hypothetical protein